MRRNGQAGFSMIELMVAMVITLIVTGAIFGLLSGGQNAFKTQPEHTDRQQNIRTAMDIIMRDVGAAGVGIQGSASSLPPSDPSTDGSRFIQIFTTGLNGIGPFTGPNGLTDQIEMLSNTSGFDNEPACIAQGNGNSSQVKLVRGTSNVPDGSIVMIFFLDGTWTIRYVTSSQTNSGASGSDRCSSGVDHHQFNFNSGNGDPTGMNPAGGTCQPTTTNIGNAGDIPDAIPPYGPCGNAGSQPCCKVDSVGFGSVIRYRIQAGADGVPNLERVENGTAQVLARGIEDMQIQYARADGTVSDGAPSVVANNFNSIITQVRVTLAARATAGKFQGATTAANSPMAIRASLTSQASPRQALWVLTTENIATPKWN